MIGKPDQQTPISPEPSTPPETGGSKVHDLKTWPEFFAALLDGSKTFEVRKWRTL